MINKIIAVLILFTCIISYVSAEDTYLESLQRINSRIDESEKNILNDINSFNAAFKDTFRLIDDEISRLIIANAAMVGGVFAIMFLVYAKTTARSKRDVQVLLAAHAKHIDNLLTIRMDELDSRIEMKLRSRDTNTLSKLSDGFDECVKEVFKEEIIDNKIDEINSVLVSSGKNKLAKSSKKPSRKISDIIEVDEAKVDIDGKASIIKNPKPGNAVLKRFKRGFLRLLGKSKEKKEVVEFKK